MCHTVTPATIKFDLVADIISTMNLQTNVTVHVTSPHQLQSNLII